ncbi:MAG: HAD family hydrolase [Actinomycetota bacterium]
MPDYRGLIVDFGGVLTTSLRDAFVSFCEREGIDYERVRAAMKAAYGDADAESLVARFETGRLETHHFERELATVLSRDLESPLRHESLVTRMLRDLKLDRQMIAAVRTARQTGIRTALLSNSWGVEYYPHDLLEELFDEIVISGRVGLRKPEAEIFHMAIECVGLPAEECLFIDDLRANIQAAEAAGMRGVLHEEASATIEELERLLGITLRIDNL